MTFRTATEHDIPMLCALAESMWMETRFRAFNFDPQKLSETFRRVIPHGISFLAETPDGMPMGAFVSAVYPHYFGNDLQSMDLGLYLLPQHRAYPTASLMIREYVRRARAAGVADITLANNTGYDSERVSLLYRRCRFHQVGGVFTYPGGG